MQKFDEMNTNPNVIKMIVGNKCDLDNERMVNFEELTEVASELNIESFYETSATSVKHRGTIVAVLNDLIRKLAEIPMNAS